MEDVKMSEEESINETESDDDSSSDVDEEIKLQENFICVLQKISNDSKNYDDYILLLDIAHDLNDLDKIRQSISLFSKEFPISPEIWIRYLKTEVSVAQTEQEMDELIKLFKTALNDYYSIDLALEYLNLIPRCSKKQVEDIWDDLMPAYGYEYSKGRLIWKAWRENYMKQELDIQEKARKVIKKFQEELLLPLNEMQQTYVEFRTFLDEYGSQLAKPFDREAFEVEVKNTKKIFQKVVPFEKKLSELDGKAHQERVDVFKNYINECADDLEEEYVQILHERMATSCCLNESVWKLYISYIQNRSSDWSPLESNRSKIFFQKDIDIVNRGLRNCNWSADLYVQKMYILERRKEPRETIQTVLETATQIQYNNPEPLVKVWIEYLTYLTRMTNFNEEKEVEILRNNFNLCWNSLGWQYGSLADCDCEILKFWGRVEYSKTKDINQGKQLWNTVMESNENFLKTGLWIEFAQLEHQYRGAEAARLVFKRALKVNELNDLPTMVSYYTRFERCNGTVEHLKYCHDVCEKIMKNYNKKVSLQKRKSLNVKKEPNDSKRKHDDDGIQQKNKKLKENTTVSRDEFQKLTISNQQQQAQNVETDPAKDSVRIFLSNLDSSITLEDLQEAFPEINILNFNMITRGKGKSGFGYAELSSEQEVTQALGMDRRLLDGRPVFISRCERDKLHRSHGFKYSTKIEPNKVFVKGLSYNVENEDLRKLFEPYGKISDIRIVTNKFGKKKGCAYVEFDQESSAKNSVMKIDQTEFMGKTLTVAISAPPSSNDSKAPQPSQHTGNASKMQPRAEQKSRISFIPASVQKSALPSVSSTTNKSTMSNDDFRKLMSK